MFNQPNTYLDQNQWFYGRRNTEQNLIKSMHSETNSHPVKFLVSYEWLYA